MIDISIKNISKIYVSDFKCKKKTAVQNLSLEIEPGEIFGIIGRNGAGKSTTLKMIMGFITPDSGQIFISGKIPADPDSRCKIGYLPENPYFYDNLTARELLTFSCQASGLDQKTSNQRIELLLKQVGLFAEQNQKLRTYSKGMTQRAGICFALVHDPDIVILDEPMSGLDPMGRKMVIDLILDLKKRGKTVLFCSHILNDVERICDRVAIMDQANLKGIYTKEQILENHGMEELFLKIVQQNELQAK
ncbi:MAG: ABC transporter ATP-binding protein [Proteobacteria bacterium]|nr:ABC transporter ATP-binding protein [Pseudomonadota bacterium]MBU1388815.1 ABC transporter ATP-binding protein [Pseudomonadota bacterium]MBU1543156.1 ABC transporter ATP-binding protein [Pseudomonadota bacterium]MBU2482583.1 ABC transporter ATP-binding protein [Pseudomonadota bacterium]